MERHGIQGCSSPNDTSKEAQPCDFRSTPACMYVDVSILVVTRKDIDNQEQLRCMIIPLVCSSDCAHIDMWT